MCTCVCKGAVLKATNYTQSNKMFLVKTFKELTYTAI